MHPLKEMRATLLVAATLIPHFSFTYGVLINITVDDWLPNHNTNEQLTFTPVWHVGQSCVTCAARPDPAVAHRGSWRDTTYNKNVVADNQSSAAFFTFNGMSELIDVMELLRMKQQVQLYMYMEYSAILEFAAPICRFSLTGNLMGTTCIRLPTMG